MKIAIKDLRPNPFRHPARYPARREKIEALKTSIADTSFWDNLLARKVGKVFELPYGFHRLIALQELEKKGKIGAYVDLPVRDLDDTMMAKIMARENKEEWAGSLAEVEQETVRSIVQGIGDGRIKLQNKGNASHPRIAPSFLPVSKHLKSTGRQGDSRYYAASLAKFLDWKESKVEAVLTALAAIERGHLSDDDFRGSGLTSHQADALARVAKRVYAKTEDKKTARAITEKLAKGMRPPGDKRPGVGGRKNGEEQPVNYHNAWPKAEELMNKAAAGQPLTFDSPKAPPPRKKIGGEKATKIFDELMSIEESIENIEATLNKNDEQLSAEATTAINENLLQIADKWRQLTDRIVGKSPRRGHIHSVT